MRTRLIDADEMTAKFKRMLAPSFIHSTIGSILFACINNEPTIDAVPVIRCKDCKYWWKENSLCTHNKHCDGNLCMHECTADDFCSDGERKIQNERSPHT